MVVQHCSRCPWIVLSKMVKLVNFMLCVYSYTFKVTGKEGVNRALKWSKTHWLLLWHPFSSALDSCMAVRASWCRTSPHQGHKGQGEEAGSPHTVTGPQTLLLPRHLPPALDVTVDSRFLPGEGGTPTLRAVTGPGSITCDLAQFSKEKSPMTPGGQQAASPTVS